MAKLIFPEEYRKTTKGRNDILRSLPFTKRGSYATAEVANILNCSMTFVQERLKSGDIVGFRLGRNWRVAPKNLADFIARQGLKDPIAALEVAWKLARKELGLLDSTQAWQKSATYLEFKDVRYLNYGER